ALEWVLTSPGAYYRPSGIPAFNLMTEHHAANPGVGKVVTQLVYNCPTEQFRPKEYAAANALIRAVATKNPDRTARAQAHLALAYKTFCKFAVAEYKRAPDEEKRAADAIAAYETLIRDYGDCRFLRSEKGTVKEFADRGLFELRHLRIGMVAPDIYEQGVDGTKLRLSDHRGKVVLLVFW